MTSYLSGSSAFSTPVAPLSDTSRSSDIPPAISANRILAIVDLQLNEQSTLSTRLNSTEICYHHDPEKQSKGTKIEPLQRGPYYKRPSPSPFPFPSKKRERIIY